MASAKDKAQPEAATPPAAPPPQSPVFQAVTNIHADGKVFAPGDLVDCGAVALAQLVAAGAVVEV